MNNIIKAAKAKNALTLLHEELDNGTSNGNNQRKAIRDYLASADAESLTRLHDILVSSK